MELLKQQLDRPKSEITFTFEDNRAVGRGCRGSASELDVAKIAVRSYLDPELEVLTPCEKDAAIDLESILLDTGTVDTKTAKNGIRHQSVGLTYSQVVTLGVVISKYRQSQKRLLEVIDSNFIGQRNSISWRIESTCAVSDRVNELLTQSQSSQDDNIAA